MGGEIFAFANSGGGRIFVGVEKDGFIAGDESGRSLVLASFAPDLLNYRGIGSGVVRALKNWPSLSWVNDTEGEEVVATISLAPKSLD